MEWILLNEQFKQGFEDKPVQSVVKGSKKVKKSSSRAAKVGRHRWNQELLKSALEGIRDLKNEMRWIRRMLERLGEARYSQADIDSFAVMDAVDREILQRLLEVGVNGVLPKDLAAEVNRRGGYGLRYYDVARRLVRLNKKLHFETGKVLFEKLGKRWVLSRFGFDVYGAGNAENDFTNSLVVSGGEDLE